MRWGKKHSELMRALGTEQEFRHAEAEARITLTRASVLWEEIQGWWECWLGPSMSTSLPRNLADGCLVFSSLGSPCACSVSDLSLHVGPYRCPEHLCLGHVSTSSLAAAQTFLFIR